MFFCVLNIFIQGKPFSKVFFQDALLQVEICEYKYTYGHIQKHKSCIKSNNIMKKWKSSESEEIRLAVNMHDEMIEYVQ